jgi:protein subunit release factor A
LTEAVDAAQAGERIASSLVSDAEAIHRAYNEYNSLKTQVEEEERKLQTSSDARSIEEVDRDFTQCQQRLYVSKQRLSY